MFVPMLWMKEIEDRSPARTIKQFAHDIFDMCRNLTTTYLLVFVVGTTMLALSPFNGGCVHCLLAALALYIPNSSAKVSHILQTPPQPPSQSQRTCNTLSSASQTYWPASTP